MFIKKVRRANRSGKSKAQKKEKTAPIKRPIKLNVKKLYDKDYFPGTLSCQEIHCMTNIHDKLSSCKRAWQNTGGMTEACKEIPNTWFRVVFCPDTSHNYVWGCDESPNIMLRNPAKCYEEARMAMNCLRSEAGIQSNNIDRMGSDYFTCDIHHGRYNCRCIKTTQAVIMSKCAQCEESCICTRCSEGISERQLLDIIDAALSTFGMSIVRHKTGPVPLLTKL